VKLSEKKIAKLVAEVMSGALISTTRLPKRSISQPDGIVPTTLPSTKAVTMPLAMPKLTA